MIRNIRGTIVTMEVGAEGVRAGHQHRFARSRRRPPEPCARYVPDGVGDQGNSRPMRGTSFLPLTSHGTGQSSGRDRLLSSSSGESQEPAGANLGANRTNDL